jgi:hypothetical protein
VSVVRFNSLSYGFNLVAVSFDTADLVIERALVQGKDVSFELKAKHEVMGSALHIALPSKLRKESSVNVKILYKTSKNCTALQWLEKECVVDCSHKNKSSATRTGRHKGSNTLISLVNVNRSTLELWLRCKVSLFNDF